MELNISTFEDDYNYIRRTGEYVQVLLCAVVVLFGLPVNLFTLCNLLKQYKQRKNNALRLLHINLNVADILVSNISLQLQF
jgi:hypothetical protein